MLNEKLVNYQEYFNNYSLDILHYLKQFSPQFYSIIFISLKGKENKPTIRRIFNTVSKPKKIEAEIGII